MTCALKTSLVSRLSLTLTLLLAGMNASCYSGPLIDGHAHWGNGFNTKAVLDRYRSSGVIAQLVMPRYLGVREDPPTTDETVLSIALENPKQMYVLAKIGELLEKHPLLHCDLSNMINTGGYGSGWPIAEPFTSKMEDDGVFIEAYKKLILNFADRFYVGMDVAHQSRWAMQQGNTFERRVQRTRELLGQLPTEVAKKLAFENVIRLFNLR